MKTMGLIGGMSWESTLTYYRVINESVKQRLGGYHSAKLVLYSVDFHEIERCQQTNKWEDAGIILADSARALQNAGAEFLLLCTNTLHKVAPAIEEAVSLPLLHIADATAAAIQAAGFSTVGLLGTCFTMEQEFYRERLHDRFGLKVLIPSQADREVVHRVIFEELCHGKIDPASRTAYLRIIDALAAQGAQGVILGCTEISLLIGQADTAVPLFDTTELHAQMAVDWALA